jgi:hypothetical protein
MEPSSENPGNYQRSILIFYFMNACNCPSWIGGVAAAKPQAGWLFRIPINVPEFSQSYARLSPSANIWILFL